jgi:ribosomal protein S18 acetylase RimI-like enzyme
MAEISLRDARIDDAKGIAEVHVGSWRVTYRGLIADAELDGLSIPERAATWRERIERGVEIVVALHGGTVAGFCAMRRDSEPPGEPVEIAALYIDPSLVRQGIGTRLMEETLRRLRAGGESEVTLWALQGNAGARAFYARHGFALTGESDEWHGAPEVRMRRRLTS